MALNSTSVIKIVDLLCEGPILGVVGGNHGVYLDETPIETAGSRNFPAEDVRWDFRSGGRSQEFLSEAGSSSSTVNDVNIEIGENYSETLNANNEVVARDYGACTVIARLQIRRSIRFRFYLLFRACFVRLKRA